MRFGLFFINEKLPGSDDQTVYREALEQCTLADELGFDAVWMGEHHFAPYGTMADTLVFGAAVSQVTTRIDIGTACIVPVFSHPVRVAEQVAMLDVMSGGRVKVGLGRGYQQREFLGFGVPQSESSERFREACEIIEGLLYNERFGYEGRFWQFPELELAPRPVQRPGPPMYIAAARTPATFQWIAERGYGALIGNPYTVDPGTAGETAELLLSCQREAGVPESLDDAWGLVQSVLVHEDSQTAVESFRANWELSNDYLVKYSKVVEAGQPVPEDYKHWQGVGEQRGVAAGYEDVLATDGCLIGSPAEVVDKLGRLWEERGIVNQLMWMNRGGATAHSDILHSMELFASEVMPQVRHLGAASAVS